MPTPLHIALIGAGVMGQQHLEHLDGLSETRLCAIADPAPPAAMLAAARGVPYFADHLVMLDEVRPDAVIIANPNTQHVQTALDCVAAGVAVLLEKPVGVHLDEVRELVRASEARGVAVLVGHHRRHNPLISKARELLASGILGRLTNVTSLWQVRKPDSYFDIPWRREPGAGMLLTNLIHDLDLLRYLCGEVESVQAITRNEVRGFANEDSVAVLLQFASGALGSLTGSDAVAAPWSWELCSGENPVYPSQVDQPCYMLAGTRGALSLPQLKHWYFEQADAGWHQPLLSDVQAFTAAEALTRQLQHFIEVVRGQAEPIVSAADAGRTLALIEAIRIAAETGQACAPAKI